MATNFSEVYEFFLSKISDYSFIDLTQSELEDDLVIYLRSAVTKFRNCKVNLRDKDDSLKVFNVDLTDDEKDVLATLMIVEYLKPHVVTSKSYKQSMPDSDFKIYSQQSHIKGVSDLYSFMKKESNQLITDYSFRERDLSKIGDDSE
jgi:hypothetical protein